MATVPKQIKGFCNSCQEHKSFKVSMYKKGRDNPIREGNRRYRIKQRGYGGQKKPIFRRKAKVTKKPVLKLECKECKKKSFRNLKRAKHVIISDDKKVKGQALAY